MFHQKVQRVNSDVSLQQQNQRFSPGPRNDFKPLPLPLTPDVKVDLSRFPTSDWIKNDPLIRRWAREDAAAAAAAAAKSSDTSNTTDVAQRTSEDDRTFSPSLETGNIDSTSSSNPSPENQIQNKRFLEPNLSRFPTSDWIKNDPMIRRWAREDAAAAAAAAKSSDTQKTAQSIQAKLTVSTPGDKYELEADAMAAKVMAMPHTAIEPQQETPNPTTPSVQRAVNEDKTVSTQLENRIQNATGGSPLPSDIRSFMEPRFGVDFSEIRVHTDSNAAAMCSEVGAKAFAVGNRIYYGAEYAPGNNELTAHELTHTIQQGAAKRFNRQVRPLPKPSEMLVAKEINISLPHSNKQHIQFPLKESEPQPQVAKSTFNRISRRIALQEIPESSLPAKQFTSKSKPNFNRIQPLSAEQLSRVQSIPANQLLSLKTYKNHTDVVAAKVGAGESASPLLADFSEQKTDEERQLQEKSLTDQHSNSSHLSQVRANPLNEAKKLVSLGNIQGNKGNYQVALKYFKEALKLAPNSSFIWYCKGLALLKLNRLQEGLDSTQTALAINTDWDRVPPSLAWNNRGIALVRLGRFNEAIQSYQQAVALDPGNELAKTNLTNLSARLSANPSLRNQSQQTPPESGNNILQTLLGALLGAFNENQTGEEAIVDFLIGLIPIIGQVADARDLAAYLYRIVFKQQFNDIWNWIGLALTLVGLVPVIGDIAKFLGKSRLGKKLPELLKNAEGVLSHLRALSPEKFDNIAQLKNLLAQNWGKGVKAAQDRWNAILGQLLNWANGIPDLLLSKEKRQLIEAIEEVSGQSNKMLSQAFDRIWEEINEALDEIGRALNPNGELVTPEGMRLPSKGVDEELNRPMLSQGSESHRQPNRSLEGIRNVANPRDESLLNSIRERLSQGNMKLQELDKGGFGTIYQIPDYPDLVIKLATQSQGGINEQLLKESTNLFNLAQKGYPTVYKGLIEWVEPNGMIRQGIVMEKVDGVLSKRILRTGKFENELRDAPLEAMVTPKTLEDLKRFRQKAENDDIIIEDLQFMISTRDGSIYLIDPARVEQLPSKGPHRREKKKQYLTRIDRLIKQFSDLFTNNQR
ncbi:eCIS core domain-containing protein [Microcoleus sp. herbarium5]|uniref:eCIS core domain-containing protein n=1 Tax=Microcoleus sp. herbarium5 TaxID=3055434 RepID=UPI002FD4C7CB